MWYGGVYLTNLQAQTGMTSTETDAFYNTGDITSFGFALMQECAMIAVKYQCANTANCTSNELSLLQWGSSAVTLDPLYTLSSDDYTPVQNTVVNWGSYGFAGLTVSPEYAVYGSTLNLTQTKRVVSNFTDYYGLNDTYNAARLM